MPVKMPSFLRTARSAAASRSQRKAASTRHADFGRLEPLEGRRLLAVNVVSVVDNTATPGAAGSFEPSVSANGRFVAFSSEANNLAADDANNARDVYLHDRDTGDTILVSHATGGGAGNGVSDEPSISADGNFVSFRSTATNLVDGSPANTESDIFIWNRSNGSIQLASVNDGGNTPSQFSAEPFTSADGNFVAYTTPTSNMVNGVTDANNVRDVVRWNRTSGQNDLVSVTPVGTSGNRASFDPSVSQTGQFVAFRSEADDLVPGADGNGAVRDIYVRDMDGGPTGTILVSRGLNGAAANGPSDSPSISADGRFIVFSSEASNLTVDDTNGNVRDVFVFDRQDNSISLVSRNQQRSGSGNGASSDPSISQEGRFVAFTSAASDLDSGDANGATDIFLYDLRTGAMALVSANAAGTAGNAASADAFVAPEGLFIVFSSTASDLATAPQTDGNGVSDVYIATAPDRDEGETNPPTAAVAAQQPANFIGDTLISLAVTYSDDVDLATTSFEPDDVTVLTPDGSVVTPTAVSSTGSGQTATVTYQIPAPGGTVDAADSGNYVVTVRAGEVADANGNTVAFGALPAIAVTAAERNGPDLTVSFADPSQPSLVAGTRPGRTRIVVTNSGNEPVPRRQRMTVSLYLSADGTVDAGDTQVYTKNIPFRARAGAGRRMNIRFANTPPAGGPNYQLLAVVDETNTIEETLNNNNTAAAPITIAPAFVDLATQVGLVRPAGVRGRPFVVPVTLTNNGNVPAVGSATFQVTASTDNVFGNGDDVLVTTTPVSKRANVRNGPRGRRVPVRFLLPETLPAGNYFFFVETTFSGTVSESNLADNRDGSDNATTIA
jgi:Tol biopolymer transport system component